MSETEREDWLALQTHPGWLRLLSYAKAQWGVKAYAQRLEKAEDMTDLKAIKMAFTFLNDVINHPTERIAQLERQAAAAHQTESMSRRGGGL